MFRFRIAAIAMIAMIIGMVSAAQARTIVLGDSGWAAQVQDGIDLTVLGVAGDFTSVSIEKFANFTEGPTPDGYIDPLRIAFFQVSSNATKYIKIADEFVINNTGWPWEGFRFILESDRLGPDGGPHFDVDLSDAFDTSPFTNKTYLNDNTELLVTGGILPSDSGNGLDNVWMPGLGSGSLVINAAPFDAGQFRQVFVFKEQPLPIPLPAAAWMGLAMLGGLGVRPAWKKLRAKLS